MKTKLKKKHLVSVAFALFFLSTSGVQADISQPGQPVTRDLTIEQRPMTQLQVPASDLEVTAWVDHENNTYMAGDKVILSIKPNKDAYLTILDVGTSGKVHIIFPNQYQKNNKVMANQIVNVPGENAHFDFKVGGPAGAELIKVIATTSAKPLINPSQTSPAGPYKAVNKSTTALAKDLGVVFRQDNKNQYADYDKVIHIVDPAATTPMPPAPAATGVTPPPAPPAVAVTGTSVVSQVQMHPENALFSLHLRTDKSVYHPGEKARIMVTPEKDCSLTLLDVGTSGQVTVLFPNRYQQDNRVLAGQTVVIPGDAAVVDYQVSGPAGVEALIGICRTDNKPVFPGQFDFRKNIYQTWGNSQVVAKDLAVVLQEAPESMAHTATTFLITE